ncbi:hypothetical protein [Paenibacillus sp. 1001270B_150601_E10]|uniref:hypothetical protein n=1 Tax=Paenibacillus sp. 1001270B_150601_E10 TaxID=2787079 RepID=UPI00189D6A62|nr:hypothetical protein [Paenibacillus sp. 1001270B_150601_E10]
MTARKLAMSLLAIIIVLEVAYYMLYLKPSVDPVLTMADLNNEAKMQRIFDRELEDWRYGDERRTRFKYVMGVTIIGGFMLASLMPNRKL